jgi:hypothetical protein
MPSGRDVDLVCGVCDAVFARVHVRPLALGMVVNSLITGGMLMPRPGYSINEEARQRLVKAKAAADGDAGDIRAHDELECARSVSDYLRSHGGDIVYDLTCRCRRRYVRTSPDLHREVRGTKGRWLRLSPGTATWLPPSMT